MRGFKVFLISLAGFILIAVALWLIRPALINQALIEARVPQSWVLGTSANCALLSRWIQGTTLDEQKRAWPQLAELAHLSEEDWNNRIGKPSVLTKLIGLTAAKGASSSPDASDCLKKAMSAIRAEPLAMIKLFKAKNYSPLWSSTLLNICHRQKACVGYIFEELKTEPGHQARRAWMDVLSELGDLTASVAYEELKGLKLGLASDDTPAEDHRRAVFLTEIFVSSQLSDSDRLLHFVLNTDHALALRWRVALAWANKEGPREELWPLVELVLNSNESSEASRGDALTGYGPLWSSHPQLVSELSRQLRQLASRLPSSEDSASLVKNKTRNLQAFRLDPNREPDSVQTSLPAPYKSELNTAIVELAAAVKMKLGPKSNSLEELMQTLREHQFFADPNDVIQMLLAHPQTADLGVDFLIGDRELVLEKIPSLRQAVDALPPDQRSRVIGENPKDLDLIAAVLPALLPSQATKFWKGPLAPNLIKKVKQLSRNEQLPLFLRTGYLAVTAQRKSRSDLNLVREHFQKEFICERDWIQSAENIVMQGYRHPAFALATLALLKCPPGQVNEGLLTKELLSKPAQNKMQNEISSARGLKAAQLKRLAEIYSHSNKVPGSALPAKVKQISQ